MEFLVLGPIELWAKDRQYDLGPVKERCLLAILLLTPGAVVPVETLIDRVWDSNPPSKATEDISVYISRLRKRLRHALDDRVHLVGRDHGYVLDVDRDAIDIHRFWRLRLQASALAARGDNEHAVLLLRQAESLWRGQPMAGLDGHWVARMRSSLEEEHRAATVERIDLELGLGRHTELLGELGRLRAQYQLDEALVAQEMRALAMSGRRSDALALYRETRQLLIDEQGTEPGRALAEVHQRVLADDHSPHLAPRQQSETATRPDTLPPDSGRFVGRAEELRTLADGAILGPRVQVIAGMPGVGKSALAIQAARGAAERYPDGLLYLNLHSHDPGHRPLSSAAALHELLQMIFAPTAGIPSSAEERAALWRVELTRRRLVVILDDVADMDQIQPILPTAGDCLILITTRRPLPGIENAGTLALDVLSAGDAVALFMRSCGSGQAVDRDRVAEVVRLCGYLPLAIRVMAGRFQGSSQLGLDDLVRELADSSASPDKGVMAHTRLAAAFASSYQGLAPAPQRLFRLLGVQPCATVTLHAAAALTGSSLADAKAALAALLDHHLLERVTADRFRFHDLVRGYAAALATQHDPGSDLRQAMGRLLEYFLHTGDRADRVLHPYRRRLPVAAGRPPAAALSVNTQEYAGQWLEAEWRSILQAARYAGEHEWKRRCADLIQVLGGFLETRAYWDEAIPAHTMALQACRELDDPPGIAQSLLELCRVCQQTGQHNATRPLAEEAITIYRSLQDRSGEATALDRLGMVHYYASNSHEALAHFREANTLYRGAEDWHGVAGTLDHIGLTCWFLGRYAEAMTSQHESLALHRKLGDRRNEAKVLNNIGDLQRHQGFHRDALSSYQESLRIFREIDGRWNHAILYSNIGCVYQYKGEYEAALAQHRRALAIFREVGDLRLQAAVLNDMGVDHQSLMGFDEALAYHQQAATMAKQIGDSRALVIARRGMADTRRSVGLYAEAQDHYLAAISLAREVSDPYEEAKSLAGLAETTLHTKGPEAARIRLRQALDIFEQIGVPEAEVVRIRIEALDFAHRRVS